MKGRVSRQFLFPLLLPALWAGCDVKQQEPPLPVSVTLTPPTANVLVGETVQFTAAVRNSSNRQVNWALSGDGCRGDSCGTISSTGLYTAPPSAPRPAFVVVRASAAADATKSASATITIVEPVDGIEWTWVSGSDISMGSGVYGTKGIAAPSNVPGAREESVSWQDPEGRFWLFGGYGLDSSGTTSGDAGDLNDLWRFDPTTAEWTWISGTTLRDQPGIYGTKGVSASWTVPGARRLALAWTDPNGSLWLFGGLGYDSTGRFGMLNDLWKFDLTSLEWTWVSGSNHRDPPGIYGQRRVADPSNVPGSRQGAASWTDPNGGLWLFGGLGHDSTGASGWLNDLWKYDPSALTWTWISGSTRIDQKGVYGAKNVSSPSNEPGARAWAASWRGPIGYFWIYGGRGYDSAIGGGTLNDLWKFDPTTLEWTWVSGSNLQGQRSNYGTKGVPSPSNVPGLKEGVATWLDILGNLWLFGGSGCDSVGWCGQLNDLWAFDPALGQWTWVAGSNTLAQNGPGIYGTRGVADPSNYPGARSEALSWTDSQGRLWLFGGGGADSTGGGGYLNDLWQGTRR